jgi:hypothetical protein
MSLNPPVQNHFSALPLATVFTKIEAFGYTVTPTGKTESPYRITGPRNVAYLLLRNDLNPQHLFAIQDRPGKFGIAKIKGYGWFAERNGELVPCK